MTFRRIAAVAVASVLLLAACGGDGGDGAQSSEAYPDLQGDAGVAPGEIKVGILADFSDNAAAISRPIADGQLAYWRSVNERQGGVAGRKVTPVVVDVKGNSANVLPGFERLVAETAVISSLLGSPQAADIVEKAAASKIVMSPTIRSSALATDPQLMQFTTPYRMQTANAVDWLRRNPPEAPSEAPDTPAPDRKFALVASDSSAEGVDSRKGWDDAKKATGGGDDAAFVDAGTFTPATSPGGLDELVRKLGAAGATDVVFGDASVNVQGLLEATDRAKSALRFVIPTDAWTPAVLASPVRQLAADRVKVIGTIASYGEDVEGMGVLVNTTRQLGLSYATVPDKWFVVGWAQARAVEALLRRAAVDGGDLTRDGLLATLRELGEVPMEGLEPDLLYGADENARIPTRASRMWEVSIDDPDDVSGLASLSRYFTSNAARDADVRPNG